MLDNLLSSSATAFETLWQTAPWASVVWAAVAVVAILYPTYIVRRYVRLMVQKLDDNTPPVEANGVDPFPHDGKEVEFSAADGHPLRGVILSSRVSVESRGMVIFCHEFGSDRTSALRYGERLLRDGFDVFAFDYRGHGESPSELGYRPRQFPSDRETSDTLGAIQFICDYLSKLGRTAEVGLFGLSRGGAAAVLAAAESPQVRAVVTDGLFSSDSTIEYLFKRFATVFARIRVIAENHPAVFWRFMRWALLSEWARQHRCTFPSTRRALAHLDGRPLLMIHGEKDCFIRLEQVQSLFETAPGPKSLWVVQGARHNQALRTAPAQYLRRVTEFFEEHLSHAPAADLHEPVVRTTRTLRRRTRSRANRPAKAFAGAA